jgi:hypothetical protein
MRDELTLANRLKSSATEQGWSAIFAYRRAVAQFEETAAHSDRPRALGQERIHLSPTSCSCLFAGDWLFGTPHVIVLTIPVRKAGREMNLEHAIRIAVEAHRGQTDKVGDPYILHPMRVMLSLHDADDRIVGILHDVVERSDWTIDRLREEGFGDDILQALDSVTRRDDETYEEFVERSAADEIGRRVKIADLKDKMALYRQVEPSDKVRRKMERYANAMHRLQS